MTEAAVIAIIDDDVSFREALEGLVKSFGFATRSFASAREFLGCPAQAAISCLIVDVQMADMGGLDLQDRLNRQPSKTPILFVTSFPDTGSQARALAAGAVAFLAKPVDADLLISGLDRALGDSAFRA